jgi:hypothetical protein
MHTLSNSKLRVIALMVMFISSLGVFAFQLPTDPDRIEIEFARDYRNRDIKVNVHFHSMCAFTDGRLYMVVEKSPGGVRDSILAWSGDSDTAYFQGQYSLAYPSMSGQKSFVKAIFERTNLVTSESEIRTAQFYAMPVSDTLVTDPFGYIDLDSHEFWYIMKKKGHLNLTDDQLKIIDFGMWKRKHQLEGLIPKDSLDHQ